MATLEDKILGEKLHNYCSSSEGEDEPDSDSEKDSQVVSSHSKASLPDPGKWEGTATNTGPKGVIKDWQRFKQLESEKRAEQEQEKVLLMKKLTLTVASEQDEQEEAEIAELLEDPDGFLLEYRKQRMQEMLSANASDPRHTFGRLYQLLNGQQLLEAIDNEHKSVTVIVHIYERNVESCHVMNSCLEELCRDYIHVKFCKIVGSQAAISEHFQREGVPALLVYKCGQLVGNFVRISADLGNDFSPEDVQAFLIQHGILPDKSCVPKIILNST